MYSNGDKFSKWREKGIEKFLKKKNFLNPLLHHNPFLPLFYHLYPQCDGPCVDYICSDMFLLRFLAMVHSLASDKKYFNYWTGFSGNSVLVLVVPRGWILWIWWSIKLVLGVMMSLTFLVQSKYCNCFSQEESCWLPASPPVSPGTWDWKQPDIPGDHGGGKISSSTPPEQTWLMHVCLFACVCATPHASFHAVLTIICHLPHNPETYCL